MSGKTQQKRKMELVIVGLPIDLMQFLSYCRNIAHERKLEFYLGKKKLDKPDPVTP